MTSYRFTITCGVEAPQSACRRGAYQTRPRHALCCLHGCSLAQSRPLGSNLDVSSSATCLPGRSPFLFRQTVAIVLDWSSLLHVVSTSSTVRSQSLVPIYHHTRHGSTRGVCYSLASLAYSHDPHHAFQTRHATSCRHRSSPCRFSSVWLWHTNICCIATS
jgi:hypothetical protein